jgi:hypothetical protein
LAARLLVVAGASEAGDAGALDMPFSFRVAVRVVM